MATGIGYRRQPVSKLREVLRWGWETFREAPGPSMGYAGIFVVIGMIVLTALGWLGISPMLLPFAGGFMLVAPPLLVGFFRLADLVAAGESPGLAEAYRAFAGAPLALWVVAFVCAFLFLVWITDAGVLYSFMIGGVDLPYELPWIIRLRQEVVAFEFWASLMGSVLAFIIFCISAFSVPLLYQGRADLVGSISASVRAAVGNFVLSILWGSLLTVVVVISIVLLPLLLVSLPVLAYASYALYRELFPPAARPSPTGVEEG